MQYGAHWIVPIIAVAISTRGTVWIYPAMFNFMTDSYQKYTGSAQGFCRNMMAGAFPIVLKPMFENLHFGPAASILGGIGLLLCLVPWILVFTRPRICAASNVARAGVD